MQKSIVFFIVVIIGLTSVDAQRRGPLDIKIDFESYDPPSSLVVPQHETPSAKFPFVDIHMHTAL